MVDIPLEKLISGRLNLLGDETLTWFFGIRTLTRKVNHTSIPNFNYFQIFENSFLNMA